MVLDPSDAPASTGVMVAFLPTEDSWCKQDLPHMTLVYAGTTDVLSPGAFNDIAKDAASLSMLVAPFYLRVLDVAVFGEEEKVNVLRFRATSELAAMRSHVERWNASQHPFSPHATIGPLSAGVGYVPEAVYFDRIYVGFGEQSLTFNLKRNNY
jgi:2'-5' RNA ligase